MPATRKKPKHEASPLLAHENPAFLNSYAGRDVRILSEFKAPGIQLKRQNVQNTLVFFGSARTLPVAEIRKQKKLYRDDPVQMARLKRLESMSPYYDASLKLSRMLSEWNQKQKENYVICSGGGPGIMEAANRGAYEAHADSVGLNIELPFEQHPNPYISPQLNLQFHFFFIRKYWFLYMAKGIVVFPGGFGTLDELFETLTLIQTQKMIKKIPIVLYGEEFWRKLINWDLMVESGMINQEDLALFSFCSDVESAFKIVTKEVMANAKYFAKHKTQPSGILKPI
jgi:uncharacterized protein (TIGR00730 family)